MDKKTKKETQSKPGAKKAPKPKYNLWQNTGFMLRTSRKYAMEILEYLDRQKITKKIDDARVLL